MPGERIGLNGTSRKLPPKLRLLTLDALDARTSATRLARQLVGSITQDLGGESEVTAAQRQLVQRAAILGALLEDAETRWINGDRVDIPQFLAAINTQRRVLAALGLERRMRDCTPTVEQYLNVKRREAEDVEADE